jgi:beta-glucosidase
MTFLIKPSIIFLFISHSLIIKCVDIESIFSKMSIEDKCGQMTQVTFQAIAQDQKPTNGMINPINLDKLITAVRDKRVGSILNTPYDYAAKKETWQNIIRLIQDVAKNTSLKIPILYGIDSIHGANYIQEATLFPQPLSMAATFNRDIARRVGEIVASETRAVGIPWNFSPVLDIGRQPLWPRLIQIHYFSTQ